MQTVVLFRHFRACVHDKCWQGVHQITVGSDHCQQYVAYCDCLVPVTFSLTHYLYLLPPVRPTNHGRSWSPVLIHEEMGLFCSRIYNRGNMVVVVIVPCTKTTSVTHEHTKQTFPVAPNDVVPYRVHYYSDYYDYNGHYTPPLQLRHSPIPTMLSIITTTSTPFMTKVQNEFIQLENKVPREDHQEDTA